MKQFLFIDTIIEEHWCISNNYLSNKTEKKLVKLTESINQFGPKQIYKLGIGLRFGLGYCYKFEYKVKI